DTFLVSEIENPNRAMIVAETSNMGALGTADPQPYKLPDGTVIKEDGFVIGWNNSNTAPDDSSSFVTRLAFYNSADGQLAESKPRHPGGIYGLSASGGYVPGLQPPAITLTRIGNRIAGAWAVPASLGR